MNRECMIQNMEDFFCQRVSQLIDEERYDDSQSLYAEFVIQNQEPTDYFYMKSMI
jgi:hypothetical protein